MLHFALIKTVMADWALKPPLSLWLHAKPLAIATGLEIVLATCKAVANTIEQIIVLSWLTR